MLERLKEKRLKAILAAHGDFICGPSDLLGGKEPSLLFFLLGKRYGKLMRGAWDDKEIEKQIKIRRKIHPCLKKSIPKFMHEKQLLENRKALLGKEGSDDEIVLPNEPVIWISNHLFKDDAGGSLVAAKRHAYILFGSIPQLYNTIDGVFAYLNGIIVINRKSKVSRKLAFNKAVDILKRGTDLLIYPEGVWNKTPNKLLLDFWPGVYRISKLTGAKIIPIVHYIKDPTYQSADNAIHTVVDDPIKIDDMDEDKALEYLREIMGTWYFLMMEKYGKSTRKIEMGNFKTSTSAWNNSLEERINPIERYDKEIELSADHIDKDYVSPMTVWKQVAEVKNISGANVLQVLDAAKRVVLFQQEDFQHKF